jgi:hypothetical protein
MEGSAGFKPAQGKRRSPAYLMLAVAAFAAVLGGLGAFLLSRWSSLTSTTSQDAERAFSEAISCSGGGPAYLEVSAGGSLRARRELERSQPVSLHSLHMLAWEPASGKLLRVAFPFWFVRMKMSETLNLGTLSAALARDWRHLVLKVSPAELQRRGPGLVFDERRADGARLLLWSD